MSKNVIYSAKTFRETFTFGAKVQTWFPGHMYSGLMKMQAKLKQVDCIVEVHDARLPLSGRNPKFQTHLMIRPHILVLNKCDLIDQHWRRRIDTKLEEIGAKNVLFTNCKDDKDKVIRDQLVPKILELIESGPRYHREDEKDFNAMIIGIPNVGKSSLTNALRHRYLHKKGRATKVGAVAGITRSVLEKIKVHTKPDIYFRDTPGIMSPHINSTTVGLKLALCATIQDHLVGEEIIADYMLYILNKYGYFDYVDHFGLKEPTDDVIRFLGQIAVDKNWIQKIKNERGELIARPDLTRAANLAIKAFREGRLGGVMLDADIL